MLLEELCLFEGREGCPCPDRAREVLPLCGARCESSLGCRACTDNFARRHLCGMQRTRGSNTTFSFAPLYVESLIGLIHPERTDQAQ